MDKLKPCPFCGEIPDANVIYPSSGITFLNEINLRKPISLVGCRHCGIDISYNPAFWNTRPAEDALKAEVERLKDALNEIRTIGDCTEMIEDVVARGMMRKIAFDALYDKAIARLFGTDTNVPTKESEGEDEETAIFQTEEKGKVE